MIAPTRLGELVSILGGGTPDRERADYYNGDIPWVTVKDLKDELTIRTSQERITKLGLENSASRLVPAGSVIVATRMAVGKAVRTLTDVAINQDLKAVVSGQRIDTGFLLFFLRSKTSFLESRASGSTVKGILIEDLQELEVALPSLPEQQQIATQLEEADRLVRTRRYALRLTDTLLAAAFHQLFGARFKSGPFRALGEMIKITGGGTPARENPEFYRGRTPWLTSKDMKGDYIWDTEEHVTEEGIEKSATKLVPAGSILVVVKSKVLMHRLPVAIAKVPLCHGQDIKSIQCSEALHPEFTRFVLKFHEGRLLNLARGANTEGLNLAMLEELPVPTVPRSEQKHFGELVKRHERLRAVQSEALRQAEHLFASLLDRAFRDP
jgi:type I restriction enzyme S subunit